MRAYAAVITALAITLAMTVRAAPAAASGSFALFTGVPDAEGWIQTQGPHGGSGAFSICPTCGRDVSFKKNNVWDTANLAVYHYPGLSTVQAYIYLAGPDCGQYSVRYSLWDGGPGGTYHGEVTIAHLTNLQVQAGQWKAAGSLLGYIAPGTAPCSPIAPHLHYETSPGNTFLNDQTGVPKSTWALRIQANP